jgi:hypothetical protein
MDIPVKPGHRRAKSSTSVLKSLIGTRTNTNIGPTKANGKENTTPPQTANPGHAPASTPIWAQYATADNINSPLSRGGNSTKVPLNDRSFEGMNHSSRESSPSKAKALGENQRPALRKGGRPKSAILTKSKSSISVFESLIPGRSGNDGETPARKSVDIPRGRPNVFSRTTKVPLRAEEPAKTVTNAKRAASRDLLTLAKKPGSKVMGLVAAFNNKSTPTTPTSEMDIKAMDAAFEAMLVC